jgi:hypothetical protein
MSFGNPTADFGQAAAQWQKLMTDSWGQWTKNTVSSESFAAASGAYMDWTLSTQKMMTEMSGQVMETLDMPRRSDLARLAAQVQSVETRLLDQEEANEDIRDLLVALNAKLDKLTASKAAPVAAVATRPAAVVVSVEPESVTPAALKEVVSQAAGEIEVVKSTKPSRKPAKKGKK